MPRPPLLLRSAWLPISLAAVLAAVVMTTACSAVPATRSAPVAMNGCEQLDAEVGRTQAGLEAARESQEDAWHLVVPFAVAARYASAGSDARAAEAKLLQLQAEADRQGCHPKE